jgi:hypothetical protein
MSRPDLMLKGLLRRALEDWQCDVLSGPWDGIIAILARAISDGDLGLEEAARLRFLLHRTGNEPDDQCPTCDCPAPGLTHALGEGSPPVWWPEEVSSENAGH